MSAMLGTGMVPEGGDLLNPVRSMDDKYDEHSAAQRGIQEANEAKVAAATRQAAAVVACAAEGVACFCVMLVGCATGLNDLILVQRVVLPEVAQRLGEDFPVQIVCADVLENSWGTVFKNAREVFKEQGNVFVSAVGGSYTEQYVRDSSMHLVLTFSCLHWFDELPKTVISSKSICFAGLDESAPAKGEIRKLSDSMLNQFLTARFKELVRGGHLIATFDAETESIPIHNFGGSTLCVQDAIQHLIEQGQLARDFFQGYFIKTASRTEVQIRSCLENVHFKIHELQFFNAACPYLEEFRKGAEREKFGKDIANAMRSCLAQEISRCLSINGCEQVDATLDLIFQTSARLASEQGKEERYSTMGAVCTMWVSAESE